MEDEFAKLNWLEPWEPVRDPAVAIHFGNELRGEMNPRHILYRTVFRAVAFTDSEEVLFIVKGEPRRLAVVDLTGLGKPDVHCGRRPILRARFDDE